MTDQTEQSQRINLEDNSDTPQANMSEQQEQSTEQAQPQPQTQSKEGGSWVQKPENLGNNAGEWIQGTLQPVGKYAGKGLETVAKPVGGIVDPLVGGVMRSGEAFGDTVGVGFGNKEGGPAKQKEAEAEKLNEPTAGKEQTADNPLGLSRES